MVTLYFDTSALVKRYLVEVGSARVLQLMDPGAGHRLWIGRLAHVELVAAVMRRVRIGQLAFQDGTAILKAFDQDRTTVYRTIEVPIILIERAMVLARQQHLRGYDAVQLACAEELARTSTILGASHTLVCADGDLSKAARAIGLVVEIPA